MGTLFFLACLIMALVFGSRWYRNKEQAAFLDSDSDDRALLEKYKVGVGIETHVAQGSDNEDPILVKAHQYLRDSQSIPDSIPDSAQASGDGASDIPLRLKKIVLSERHRNLLQIIEQELGSRFRVFVHLPLKDFVEGASEDKRISFLVCEADYFNVTAGIDISDVNDRQNGPDRTDYLQKVFSEINKPLILLPKKPVYTVEEVSEALKVITGAALRCPNCGFGMEKRKLNSPSNKWIWICGHYPRCKGHRKMS